MTPAIDPKPETPPRWWQDVDGEDVGLFVTLVLLAIGGWMAWRPAACLLPALLLAWLTIPPRPKFFDQPPAEMPAKRRA